ncbi:response regulator [Paenibacillus dokdonensis]|uniref:response regulator n=1 Tax=Paenibacillus dokdonensis TaxID=2567944 RepID=UPI0010A943CB|nr:response regulator [Paenibacillus dokdonensis]
MKLRILVADDTKFMRTLMRDFLEQGGHQVVGEAVNGHEAVKMYEKQQPDVVFMDITMPELDGVAAMEKILRINPSAIIIICSVMSQQELISEAVHKGAKGYIMKPFQPGQVEEAITNYALPHIQVHQMPNAIGSIMTTGDADEMYPPALMVKPAPPKKFIENIVPMEQAKQNKQQVEEEQVSQEKLVVKQDVLLPVEKKAEIQTQAQVQREEQVVYPVQNEAENDSLIELASLVMNTPVSSTEGQLETVSEEWNLETPLLPEELSILLESKDSAEDLSSAAPILQAFAPEPVLQKEAVDEAVMKFSPSAMEDLKAWQKGSVTYTEIEDEMQKEPAFAKRPMPDSNNMNAHKGIYEEHDHSTLMRSGNHQEQEVNFTGGDFEMKGFSTHYQLQWQELFRGEEHADYTVLYREGEERLSIKMSMNQSKQTVNISIVALRQLVKWIEPKLQMDMEGNA